MIVPEHHKLWNKAAPSAGAAHCETDGMNRSVNGAKVDNFATTPNPKTMTTITDEIGGMVTQMLRPQIM